MMPCGNRGVPLIVFADDDPDILEVLVTHAKYRGYEAVGCQTGRELLEAVNSLCESGCCPDMVVADVHYFDRAKGPRVTGITAGAQIRAKFPDVPILYLTAFASTLIKKQAREQGAEVQEKPLADYDAFFERIAYMMNYTGSKSYYKGRERRKQSINHTGECRRATDRRLEVPTVVAEALQLARKAQNG